jgi:uncharacterized membrane protein HdeD (DUF308 family)
LNFDVFIFQEVTMNMRRSTLPAKASTRSIVSGIVMLIGILVLAWGYYGGNNTLIYLGLIAILGGVVSEIIFGLLRESFKSILTRRHI